MLEEQNKGGRRRKENARTRKKKKEEEDEENVKKTARKAAKSRPAEVFSRSRSQPLWTNSPDFGKMVDSPRAGLVPPRRLKEQNIPLK